MKNFNSFARFYMNEETGGEAGGGAGEGSGGDAAASGDGGQGSGQDTGGQGSGGAKSPFESLPTDVVEAMQSAGIKDIESLASNWRDAQSYIGSSIRVPSENAGEEDWNKFYEKIQKHAPNLMPRPNKDNPEEWEAYLASIGRPQEPSGYEAPEVPEGVDFPEERLEFLRKVAHEQGLNKEQFKGLLNSVLQADAATAKQYQENIAAEQQAIRKEWGSAYDERSNQVVKMLELTGAPEQVQQMAKDGQLGSDTLKWMYEISNNFKGEGTNLSADQGNDRSLTPSEAQAQISEIYSNPKHAFFVPDHPDHKAALDKMIKLTKAAYPSASDDPRSLRTSISTNG